MAVLIVVDHNDGLLDHCFGHHICSLLTQVSFVDHCFGDLLDLLYFANLVPSPSHPSLEVVHGRYQVR